MMMLLTPVGKGPQNFRKRVFGPGMRDLGVPHFGELYGD